MTPSTRIQIVTLTIMLQGFTYNICIKTRKEQLMKAYSCGEMFLRLCLDIDTKRLGIALVPIPI